MFAWPWNTGEPPGGIKNERTSHGKMERSLRGVVNSKHGIWTNIEGRLS